MKKSIVPARKREFLCMLESCLFLSCLNFLVICRNKNSCNFIEMLCKNMNQKTSVAILAPASEHLRPSRSPMSIYKLASWLMATCTLYIHIWFKKYFDAMQRQWGQSIQIATLIITVSFGVSIFLACSNFFEIEIKWNCIEISQRNALLSCI